MGYYDQVNTKGRASIPKPDFVNDTRVPKVPKVPFSERAGTAIGKFMKPLIPYAKAIPGVGTAATVAGTLMSDVNKTPENRTFPKAGAVADETRRLQGEADGFVAREMEGLKGAFPLVGGLMHDVKDRVANYYGNSDLGPGIELTPGAAEAERTGIPYKAPVAAPTETSASTGPASTSAYDLILAQLGGQGQSEPEAAPVAVPNESYFINNQTGVAPGEKQYFRDLPGTTLNDPKPQLPQQLPAATQGQSPQYESPMAAATKNLNLARFDASEDSFGDLLAKRLHNVSEGQKLIHAKALTAEQAEQQRRSEEDRDFGLQSLGLEQNLAISKDELAGRNKQSFMNNLVRLRGQDIAANTSRTNAMTKANTPLSFADQLKEQNALAELNLRDFPDAPSGFAEAASRFVQEGASRRQIQDAYDWVSAVQAKNTGKPVDELDPQKLYDAVKGRLGL